MCAVNVNARLNFAAFPFAPRGLSPDGTFVSTASLVGDGTGGNSRVGHVASIRDCEQRWLWLAKVASSEASVAAGNMDLEITRRVPQSVGEKYVITAAANVAGTDRVFSTARDLVVVPGWLNVGFNHPVEKAAGLVDFELVATLWANINAVVHLSTIYGFWWSAARLRDREGFPAYV